MAEVFVDDFGFEYEDANAERLFGQYKEAIRERESTIDRSLWEALIVKITEGHFDKQQLCATESLQTGAPGALRAKYWRIVADWYRRNTQIASDGFAQLIEASLPEATVAQIEKDLGRTFPNNAFFRSDGGRVRLKRVLTAYAARNTAVGYCQGMNSIAGLLLLFLPDEEQTVFWLLCYIVEQLAADYWLGTLLGSLADMRLIEQELIPAAMPDLASHIHSLNLILQVVSSKWFINMFSETFAPQTFGALVDVLLIHGTNALFAAGLGLLSLNHSKLTAAENNREYFEILQSLEHGYFVDPNALLVRGFKLLYGLPKDLSELKQRFRDLIAKEMDETLQKRQILQLQKQTHFTTAQLTVLQKEFGSVAHEQEAINFEQFVQVFTTAVPAWRGTDLHDIFRLFDVNSDGVVDFKELMCGLSIFHAGSLDEKLHFCFQTFDTDNSGTLDLNEVNHMFAQVYSLYGKHFDRVFVEKCFNTLDVNHDGVLSFQEFRKIVILHPMILEAYCTPIATPATGKGSRHSRAKASPAAASGPGRAPTLHITPTLQRSQPEHGGGERDSLLQKEHKKPCCCILQ